MSAFSSDGPVAISPAADALDFGSLQSLDQVGDRLRSLEQLARTASTAGYSVQLGNILQETARQDSEPSVAHLAREILGSLSRWDWWPASQVAPAMTQIERAELAEDVLPVARQLTCEVPGYFHGWVALAHCLAESLQWREASTACARALALRPDHIPTRRLAGYVDVMLGNLDSARVGADQLLRDAPSDSAVRFHSGWVHERRGDFELAVDDYLAAARSDDQEPHWVAVQQAALRIDRWEMVLEADRALVRLNPDDPTAHHQCAVACEENHLFDEAAFHLAEAQLHGSELDWRTGSDHQKWLEFAQSGR